MDPPMLVPPDAPVTATLVETTGFTLDAQGTTLVGQPADLSTTASVQMDLPILNAIAISPAVSAVDPPGGDPAAARRSPSPAPGSAERPPSPSPPPERRAPGPPRRMSTSSPTPC